jgi:diguanylate cyclase (GGDEF)-like protein/PAS domain S-box-containing protein
MSAQQRPLILIIDDDPMMRFLAREALDSSDFRSAEAGDGVTGLALVETLAPELVLLDVQMPGLDGFAVCAELRARPHGQHLPILMMTGLDDVESIRHAYQVGATDFITKPLNFTLLRYRLDYMLRAKVMGDALRTSESTLAAAQRIARLAHWEYRPEHGFTRWSWQTNEVFGLPHDTDLSAVDQLLAIVRDEEQPAVRAAFQNCAEIPSEEPIEYQVRDSSGNVRFIQQHMQRQIDNGTVRFIGTVQDITARRHAEQQIHNLAFYDSVTGLPNLSLLEQRLRELLELTREQSLEVTVLIISVNHFQRFNDHFGHGLTNELLVALGRRLTGTLRREATGLTSLSRTPDVIGRIASDEFCMAIPHANAQVAGTNLARRVHDSLRQPFSIGGEESMVAVTIGVAGSAVEIRYAEELLRYAHLALNHAKRGGRDHTVFYEQSMDARAEQRLSLENKLRQAIGTEQISLHYQPKLRTHDLALIGMEALLRWEHPELGKISPAEFIPIAEETGLIIPLGSWVLREACRQVVAWSNQGITDLVCAVNISAAQFRDGGFPNYVADTLRDTGAPASLIQLELTESLVMQDEKLGLAILNQLKALGLSLAIDDFGTGYSSLSYLKRLPVDTVKIDQSFVRELAEHNDDAAIVEAVVLLAHSLGLKVVAEGVEQKSQLDFLRTRRCDEVQGYLFARPMPSDAFAAWVLPRLPRLAPMASAVA